MDIEALATPFQDILDLLILLVHLIFLVSLMLQLMVLMFIGISSWFRRICIWTLRLWQLHFRTSFGFANSIDAIDFLGKFNCAIDCSNDPEAFLDGCDEPTYGH